jgi:uncharacterized protein YndB with AHSA1/START domain
MTAFNNDAYAEFPARGELRIVRLLPGPIERVWEFLTDPEKRSRWFAGGITELKPGGKIEFAMHHAKLSPHETPPETYAHVHEPGVTFAGRVLRAEPPRLLVFTFGDENSVVTFDLKPQGGQVLLVVSHRSTDKDIKEQPSYAGGWHAHLALLVALLEGKPLPPFWGMHAHLAPIYARLALT